MAASRVVTILTTALISVLFLLAIQPIVFSWELDNLSMRQKMFSANPTSRANITPITLVSIDLKTLGSDPYQRLFGQNFSRRSAAYAVRFLKRSQPQSVIFDISFNGGVHYDRLADDQAFADSLKGTQHFASLLSFNLKQEESLKFSAQPKPVQEVLQSNRVQVEGLQNFPAFQLNYHFSSMVPPYPMLLQSPMRFFSSQSFSYKTNLNLPSNDDAGLEARRWIPFSIYDNQIFPTLPLGALLHGQNQLTLKKNGLLQWPGGQIHLGSEGIPLIKWQGHGVYADRPVYTEVSFSDLVLSEVVLSCRDNPKLPECKSVPLPSQPPLDPQQFNGQYVLIGFALPQHADSHKTIYGPKYSGLYIVANILDNALQDDFVQSAPLWLNLLFCLLLPSLLILGMWRYKSIWLSLIITLTLALGHLTLCIYAYNQWNLWLAAVQPALAVVVSFGGIYIYRYITEYKKRQQLRYAFGKYVSPAVLQIIEQHPEKVKLGGERREMTFLFSDIRGFTSFSDQNPPEEVQSFLSQYFATMNKLILDHQGSINKLIGDAIMAYWGFPLENEDHAFQTVCAAMAMRDAMQQWQHQADKFPMKIGIGINTGEAVVGNIGSEEFMDFTVIGDSVNIASRLEGLNKEFSTTIIISAATHERVKDRIQCRYLGQVELKGKETKVEVYEPLSFLTSNS